VTKFSFEGESRILLVQELPFQWGFQPGLCEQVVAFWKLAKHCHRLLLELAVEETYQGALHLEFDLDA
jgi:hypothetical protein